MPVAAAEVAGLECGGHLQASGDFRNYTASSIEGCRSGVGGQSVSCPDKCAATAGVLLLASQEGTLGGHKGSGGSGGVAIGGGGKTAASLADKIFFTVIGVFLLLGFASVFLVPEDLQASLAEALAEGPA